MASSQIELRPRHDKRHPCPRDGAWKMLPRSTLQSNRRDKMPQVNDIDGCRSGGTYEIDY